MTIDEQLIALIAELDGAMKDQQDLAKAYAVGSGARKSHNGCAIGIEFSRDKLQALVFRIKQNVK